MTNIFYSAEQLTEIRTEAQIAAHKAAEEFFQKELGGVDQLPCGFAWIELCDNDGRIIKGSSRLGRELKKAGINKNWDGVHQIWNPSNFPCQNIDTLKVGAVAAAEVFKEYGFFAHSCSRLD